MLYMKSTGLLSIMSVFCLLAQAQIPNSGFESWTSLGSYEVPDQWGNMNSATESSGVYTTLKGSPGATGNYYIKLTTKDVKGVITPGVIVSGQLNSATWLPESGFPFNQRVESLIGKYQFMGYGNDVATIAAWLTRWNPVLHRRDTVANLWRNTSGMIHVWTGFSIPFAYQSTETPDTAIIMISSSSHTPVKNSFIWVDDLNFDGMATSVQRIEPFGNVSIFPSLSGNEISISFSSKISCSGNLIIFDISGKIVYHAEVMIKAGDNVIRTNPVNVRPLTGMYFIQLETSAGLLTRKFMINR